MGIFKFFKSKPLHVNIMIGLIAGALWAYISIYMGWNQFTIDWIAPFGKIFINLLKLIAIPLVLFSIISGVAELSDISTLGRMGLKTVSFYLVTTIFAVVTGLLLVNTIKPGAFLDEEQRVVNRISYEMWVEETPGVQYVDDHRYLSDPEFKEYRTLAQDKFNRDQSDQKVNETISKAQKRKKDSGPLDFIVDMVPSNIFLSFNDSLMLQVIFFAVLFGITLVMLPDERVSHVVGFVHGSNAVFIKMVEIVMLGAPFFVFALLSGVLAKMANTIDELKGEH